MPASRGRWLLLAVLAAVGLVVLLLAGEPGPTSPRPGTVDGAAPADGGWGPAAETSVLEAPDTPTAELVVAPPAGASDPTAADGLLRVQVLRAEDRAPLAGARVEVWEDPLDLPPEQVGVPLTGLSGAALSADEAGRVALPLPAMPPSDRPSGWRVLASAPGYRVGEARFLAAPAGEVRLVLQRGLAIEGLVLDRQGLPRAGVALHARHVLRPGLADAALLAGAESATATSAEDGTFRLEGLSPGLYRVAAGEGWRLLPGGRLPPDGTFAVRSEVPVNAGAAGVRLVVGQQAWLRLALVETGGERVNTPDWSLTARLAATGETLALHGALSGPGAGPPLGEVDAPVLLASAAEVEAGAEVEVRVPGYKPARAHVPLALDRTASDPVGVLLEPEAAGAWVTVDGARLELAPGPAGLLPGDVLVSVCHLGDGRLRRRHAWTLSGSGAGDVEAGPFPPGESEVRVAVDGRVSEPLRVRLVAGERQRVEPTFPAPTGVVVRLTDRFGRRVFDAESLVLAREGQTRGMRDHAWATRAPALPVRGVLRETLLPLAPGTYRWATWKQGVGYASGRLTVAEGSVATLTARLDPEGFTAASRAAAAAAGR